jgi:ribosomal protein S18 acetylase RimI-like enzyme
MAINIGMVITNGANGDFIDLTKLLDKEFYETFGDIQKQYEKFNRLDDIHDVVMIYNGKEPIACGSFKKYDHSTVEIKRVFVRKEYRQMGFATKVMQQLEKIAIEKGFSNAILETGVELIPAVRLYKSLGYKTIDNYDQYEQNAICVCMRKQIL